MKFSYILNLEFYRIAKLLSKLKQYAHDPLIQISFMYELI